jgi:hypothetical protein
MASQRKTKPRIAHKIPGRIRIKLPSALGDPQIKALVQDLKLSPEVKKVSVSGLSLIIEHDDDEKTLTAAGEALSKIFPNFARWSDEVDTEIAKAVADPWVNKIVPLGLFGIAIFTGVQNGAILAGESAFALGYVAFDLYWKFQQENVIRKIEKGLSDKDKEKLGQD